MIHDLKTLPKKIKPQIMKTNKLSTIRRLIRRMCIKIVNTPGDSPINIKQFLFNIHR